MSDDFNPRSADSMFATLIAEMKAQNSDREAFRNEVRNRFNRGAERMSAQDAILAEIKTQTLKTNGRVTKLEQGWKILCAKAIGAACALTIAVKILLWAHEAKLIP
jgi:hypothetical protein